MPVPRRLALAHLSKTTASTTRLISTTPKPSATPLPHPTVSGPPPKAPTPSVAFPSELIQRKRKQAELLKAAQALKTNPAKPSSALQRRFWKEVRVQASPDDSDSDSARFQILLDQRPVRTASKEVLLIPHTKKHLAVAIALEWDALVSAQQALKSQYIPLTSLTSRAIDIEADGAAGAIRASIVKMLLGYLRTDTLLCWAPPPTEQVPPGEKSLRETQEEVARPIVEWLTTYLWPGVELRPALEDGSILPTPQPEMTVAVVQGWLTGLPAWELAGLERAVLASKSLCVGVRLVAEWSRHFAEVRAQAAAAAGRARSPLLGPGDGSEVVTVRVGEAPEGTFGVYEAERACTLEVEHQTRNWGEVEDTHDVNREDLRRQLGSAVLVVQ